MSKLIKVIACLFRAVGVGTAIKFARSANLRTVRQVFTQWSDGSGSLFDLMIDDALVVIPGTSAHCGTFSKSAFLTDVATPFMARFNEPPRPHALKVWADADDIAVLADAKGITSDGKPYANSYVFVLKMRGGRIAQVTEFLDMAAFNDVWDRVEPATVGGAVVK